MFKAEEIVVPIPEKKFNIKRMSFYRLSATAKGSEVDLAAVVSAGRSDC